MTTEKYIKDVMKTAATNYKKIAQRLVEPSTLDLLHAAIGMSTESGEILDMVKKHIFYGADLDLVNLEEELGDSNFYQSLAIHAARMKDYYTSWEQICDKNIEKLRARYGDKFSEDAALNRDLNKEREILEGSKEKAEIDWQISLGDSVDFITPEPNSWQGYNYKVIGIESPTGASETHTRLGVTGKGFASFTIIRASDVTRVYTKKKGTIKNEKGKNRNV